MLEDAKQCAILVIENDKKEEGKLFKLNNSLKI